MNIIALSNTTPANQIHSSINHLKSRVIQLDKIKEDLIHMNTGTADDTTKTDNFQTRLAQLCNRNNEDLLKAFKTLDNDAGSGKITRGELRRALDLYCCPLTTHQFDEFLRKHEINSSGPIRYQEFLSKLTAATATEKCATKQNSRAAKLTSRNGKKPPAVPMPASSGSEPSVPPVGKRNSLTLSSKTLILDPIVPPVNRSHTILSVKRGAAARASSASSSASTRHSLNSIDGDSIHSCRTTTHRYHIQTTDGHTPNEAVMLGIDEILSVIQTRILRNPEMFLKALRLFDYNMDNMIQQHELRKVIENHCCRLNDTQFDKLWQRFNLNAGSLINYLDFLRRIGIPLNEDGTMTVTKSQTAPTKPLPSICNNSNRNGEQPSGGGVHLVKARSNDAELNGDDLLRLEFQLRRRIQQDWDKLYRAFSSFDPNSTGFVRSEELHDLLNQFVFPMTADCFQQLIRERLGIRDSGATTGKIAWLTFLKKFRDPQAPLFNGQTLPIRQDTHKCNPIMGAEQATSIDRILQLLWENVNFNRNSMKNAFLQLDIKRTGRVSLSKLKRIMRQFKFVISEMQMIILMRYLDPENRGSIDYHEFLNLFEAREDIASHKWLNSQHRFNAHQTRFFLGINQIKEILHQQFTKKWADLVKILKKFDPHGKNQLSRNKFRKLLDMLTIHLDDESIAKFLDEMICTNHNENEGTSDNDKFNYLKMLEVLKIDVNPADLMGPSTRLIEASDKAREDRLEDHIEKMQAGNLHAFQKTNQMTIEELAIRLRDCIQSETVSMRELFNKYVSTSADRKIDQMQLRKILDAFGFYTSNETFKELCEFLGCFGLSESAVRTISLRKDAKISYDEFLKCFEDNSRAYNHLSGHKSFLPDSNHKVNEIRGEHVKLNADQAEQNFRTKMRSNFSNLREVFEKFATLVYEWGDAIEEKKAKKSKKLAEAYLDRKGLEKMLASFNCNVDQSELASLCERFGLSAHDEHSKITYDQFLAMFQEQEDLTVGHQWLTSTHKFNSALDHQKGHWSGEKVFAFIAEKLYELYPDFTKILCRSHNKENMSLITPRQLRELLETRLAICMQKAEFAQLWRMYDPDGKGAIGFEQFKRRAGLNRVFTSGDDDLSGPSANIIQQSSNAVQQMLADQEHRHTTQNDSQFQLAAFFNLEAVMEKMRTRVLNDFASTLGAFRRYESDRQANQFDLSSLYRLLQDLHVQLDEQQFGAVAAHIGLHTHAHYLTYEEFCKAFAKKIGSGGAFVACNMNATASNQQQQQLHQLQNSQPIMARQRSMLVGGDCVSGGGGGGDAIGQQQQQQVEVPPNATTEQLMRAFKNVMSVEKEFVQKTFRAMDRSRCGQIGLNQLRSVLQSFLPGKRLTDTQFSQIVEQLSENYIFNGPANSQSAASGGETATAGDQILFNYEAYLSSGLRAQPGSSIESDSFGAAMQKLESETGAAGDACSTTDELIQLIEEKIGVRLDLFENAFLACDPGNLGAVCASDFRQRVLARFAVRLTDDQFRAYWQRLQNRPANDASAHAIRGGGGEAGPSDTNTGAEATALINEFGNLKYPLYLAMLSQSMTANGNATATKSTHSNHNAIAQSNRANLGGATRTEEGAKRELKHFLDANWHRILYKCRAEDQSRSTNFAVEGKLEASVFLKILRDYGFQEGRTVDSTNDKELEQESFRWFGFARKASGRQNNAVCVLYNELIRHFVLANHDLQTARTANTHIAATATAHAHEQAQMIGCSETARDKAQLVDSHYEQPQHHTLIGKLKRAKILKSTLGGEATEDELASTNFMNLLLQLRHLILSDWKTLKKEFIEAANKHVAHPHHSSNTTSFECPRGIRTKPNDYDSLAIPKSVFWSVINRKLSDIDLMTQCSAADLNRLIPDEACKPTKSENHFVNFNTFIKIYLQTA